MSSRSSNGNNLRNPPRGERATWNRPEIEPPESPILSCNLSTRLPRHQTPLDTLEKKSLGHCQLVSAIVWLYDIRDKSVVVRGSVHLPLGDISAHSSSLLLICQMRLLKTPPWDTTSPLYTFLLYFSYSLFIYFLKYHEDIKIDAVIYLLT